MLRRFLCMLSVLFSLFLCVQTHASEVVFATFPSNANYKLEAAFSPLVTYLAKESGDTVRLVIASNYGELESRLADGSVDFAWIGTSGYVRGKAKVPDLVYLATYQEWNQDESAVIPFYRGVLVSLAESGIASLHDMRGTRIGFTDKGSSSGYTYPMLMLRNNGIDPSSFFRKQFFLRRHDKVIEALVARSIDVGAVSDGTYYNAVHRYGDIFTVVCKTQQIPLDAIVASPLVPAARRRQYRNLLLSLPADCSVFAAIKQHLGWPAAGFTVKNDAFYDSLRNALNLQE